MRAIILALMASIMLPAAARATDRIASGPGTKAVLGLSGVSGNKGDSAIDYPQDGDWYRLDVVPGTNYVAEVDGDSLPDDNPLIDLKLWDANAHRVYYQAAGNAHPWFVETHVTTVKFIAKASTVFLGLSANKQASTGTYHLSLHPSCAHNKATICTIEPGETKSGFRGSASDSLWFRAQLEEGVTYTTSDYLQVHDARGGPLDIADCNISCTFTAPYGGLYFLAVSLDLTNPHDVGFGGLAFTLTPVTSTARVAAKAHK